MKYLKDKDLSEETVQDVFVNIWEKRDFINIKISFKSYLYIAVRNKCLQYLDRQKLISIYKKHIEKNEISAPDEYIIFKETLDVFYDVLNNLPERCAQIFKMSRFEGLKYREIAQKLNISVKTTEADISKALKQFRIYFPDYK